MSERLTDEELDEAFAYALGSLRLTAALSEVKERRSLDEHRRKSDEELIARRHADLTAEDREALSWFADVVRNASGWVDEPKRDRALWAITKLLDSGKAGR